MNVHKVAREIVKLDGAHGLSVHQVKDILLSLGTILHQLDDIHLSLEIWSRIHQAAKKKARDQK